MAVTVNTLPLRKLKGHRTPTGDEGVEIPPVTTIETGSTTIPSVIHQGIFAMEVAAMECSKCKSANITTNGTTKAGTQRYRCRDCGANIATGKRGRAAKSAGLCTHCGSTHTKKAGGRDGKRIYCYNCQKTFSSERN